MAGPQDPFTPGDENPDQRVAPQQQNALQGFLTDPRGQAALLQFGLGLMGGRSWGDNPASQIARAVGGSGEAVRTSETEQRAAEEAQSRIAERKSRGASRGASQDLKERGLDLKEQELEVKRQRLQQSGAEFQQRHALNKQKYDGMLAIAQSKLANAKTDQERQQARDEIDTLVKQQRIDSAKINDEYTRAQTEQLTTGPQQKDAAQRLNLRAKASAAYQKYRGNILDPGPKMSYQEFLRQNYPDLAGEAAAPAGPATTAPGPGPTTAPTKPTSGAGPGSYVGEEREFSTNSGQVVKGVWDGKAWKPKTQQSTAPPADTTEEDTTVE